MNVTVIGVALVMVGGSLAHGSASPSFPAIDAEPLGAVSENALVLHDGWELRDAPAGVEGDGLSKAGYDGKDWFKTTVPTTVLGTLVRHGVYPDPYIGTNNMRIPDACPEHNTRYGLAQYSHLPGKANPWSKPWWFRREFSVPESYRGRMVWLHLDGINYRADVWLNGHRVATADSVAGMFRRFRFEVSSLLDFQGTNALAITVHPLDFPGDPAHEQLDGLLGGFGPNTGDGVIMRNVTQYGSVGWDWVPAARDRNMGLWQHVWLEATDAVAVRDPAAFTAVKLPAGEEAAVTLRCHLETAGKGPVDAELVARIEPEGFAGPVITLRQPVRVPPGAPAEFILTPQDHPALILKNPRLWWPVTYGGQPLYRLTLEALVNGRSSSRAVCHFGVRTVGSYILPSGGRAFTVNGRTIRMTGGAWVPDYLMSWGAQRYRDEVRLMAEGNHTMVRVNGNGIVPPEVFFDACDRHGLLVWQDLARTSISESHRKDGIKWWFPPRCDPALYLGNMTDSILRLRGHPSLLVWCGSNEAEAQADVGMALQDEILPALDGTRPWLPSSHDNPPWRKEDVCIWTGGPWHLVRLPEYYRLYLTEPKYTCRDEIGLPSVPTLNLIARFLPDFDQPDPATFPLNRTSGYHDATDKHFRSLDDILRADVGAPAGLAEYLKIGDLYNEASYRAIFEAANKARPRNAGTHLWKVNAAWPSFMWQVYDWSLRPNAGYYSMRSACKPLHVQASPDDFHVQVVSTLDTPCPRLQVRMTVVGLDGSQEALETRVVDVPADATVDIGPLPAVVRNGKLHVVALDLLDAEGAELDRTVVWLQKDHRWQDLLTLPPAEVKAEVVDRTEHEGETLIRVRVGNVSAIPALQVWLAVLGGALGEEVLPCFWSGNALTLLPGEQRDVTARFRTALMAGARPHVSVEGWNVTPCERAVEGGAITPMSVSVSAALMKPGQVLSFTVEQISGKGPHYTTWPVPVWMDGQLLRTVRVGLRGGAKTTVTCPLAALPSGRHSFDVGESRQPAGTVEIPPALWTIGRGDDGVGALAFNVDYKTRAGAKFVVGVSDPARDWPAVQPGPNDKWGGPQALANVVNFRVEAQSAGTGAYLVLKMMNCDRSAPPTLTVELNGCKREIQIPVARSSEALQEPKLGANPFRMVVTFPEGTLKAGENALKIITSAGGWLIYEGLELHPL
jgi:exo-1,4-beta-D-glucosaminidase